MGIKSTYSRHMGGVWERMIRTNRQALKATLKGAARHRRSSVDGNDRGGQYHKLKTAVSK